MMMKDKILLILNYKIDDTFLRMQKEMGITSGDVEPLDNMELMDTTELLAEIIEKILLKQKGDA